MDNTLCIFSYNSNFVKLDCRSSTVSNLRTFIISTNQEVHMKNSIKVRFDPPYCEIPWESWRVSPAQEILDAKHGKQNFGNFI